MAAGDVMDNARWIKWAPYLAVALWAGLWLSLFKFRNLLFFAFAGGLVDHFGQKLGVFVVGDHVILNSFR